MLIFRWVVMLLLLAAAVCFAFYAGTGFSGLDLYSRLLRGARGIRFQAC